MINPPYCLKFVVFAAGILCALLALGLLLTDHADAASVLFGLALTAGLFIAPAARAVARREHEDLLARYATRPVKPTNPVAGLVARTGVTLAVLALVTAWAQQTPNQDAAVARESCAGSRIAGSESC